MRSAVRGVLRVTEQQGSSPIAELYASWLRPFLAGPRNFWSHVVESRRPYYRVAGKIASMDRYLNEQERAVLGTLEGAFVPVVDGQRLRVMQGGAGLTFVAAEGG